LEHLPFAGRNVGSEGPCTHVKRKRDKKAFLWATGDHRGKIESGMKKEGFYEG